MSFSFVFFHIIFFFQDISLICLCISCKSHFRMLKKLKIVTFRSPRIVSLYPLTKVNIKCPYLSCQGMVNQLHVLDSSQPFCSFRSTMLGDPSDDRTLSSTVLLNGTYLWSLMVGFSCICRILQSCWRVAPPWESVLHNRG